jgi:hypothetical protein
MWITKIKISPLMTLIKLFLLYAVAIGMNEAQTLFIDAGAKPDIYNYIDSMLLPITLITKMTDSRSYRIAPLNANGKYRHSPPFESLYMDSCSGYNS